MICQKRHSFPNFVILCIPDAEVPVQVENLQLLAQDTLLHVDPDVSVYLSPGGHTDIMDNIYSCIFLSNILDTYKRR